MQEELMTSFLVWMGAFLCAALFLLVVWGLLRAGRGRLVWGVVLVIFGIAGWGAFELVSDHAFSGRAYAGVLVRLVVPAILGAAVGAWAALRQRG